MATKKNTNKSKRSILGKSKFSVFLILFALLEVLLVALLINNALNPPTIKDPTPPPSGGKTPATQEVVIPEDTPNTAELSAIDSKYAILFNARTGEVLASRNADTKFSPASLTKVMTLIVACETYEESDLERKLAHTQEIIDYVSSGNYKGTTFALKREENYIGDTFTVKDLLYGIGVASAADCTYMIVKDIAQTEDAFVELMNEKAEEMGLENTKFDNAVGFESKKNLTTAREMATIMAYALQNELIADILQVRDTPDGKYKITGHYNEGDVEKEYSLGLTISLDSRLEKYPEFSLKTSTLEATKTGYTSESFMVASATGNTSMDRYILVLGDSGSPSGETLTEKFKKTMIDMESILNQYAK